MKIVIVVATLMGSGLVIAMVFMTYLLFFKAADKTIDRKFEERK